jgi:protein-S-isoprenylcysteine O-methyltransferase Ste14
MNEDRPRILAPPPLLFLICLIVGGVLSWLVPLDVPHWPSRAGLITGILLFIVSGSLAVSGFRAFRSHRTPSDPTESAITLIQSGPFRLTRNPLYLANLFLLAAFACLAGSVWMFAFLVVLFLLLRYGVVGPEERYLEAKFGQEYRSYKARVRRWL